MSLATFSVSERIAPAMVELIESAASAVSSTAAVIWSRSARSSSHSGCGRPETGLPRPLPWIEPLASTVWRVRCWIDGDLVGDVVVAPRGLGGEAFTSWATTAKPRPASPCASRSIVALESQQIGGLGNVAISRGSIRSPRRATTALADLDAPSAWPPARIATPAAVSTSVRASSIARIRPAAVERLPRMATADCSAAGCWTSLVLRAFRGPSGSGPGAFGPAFAMVGAVANEIGDAALELLALAAAWSAASIGFEQGDLGEDDVC